MDDEALGLAIAVLQTLAAAFAGLRVVPGNLLEAWMIIIIMFGSFLPARLLPYELSSIKSLHARGR